MFATTFGKICLCVKIHTRKCCPPGVCGWTNMISANWHPSYHHHWLGAGIITRCHMPWQSLSLIKTSSKTREWRQNVYKDTAFNFGALGKKYTSHFQIAKSVFNEFQDEVNIKRWSFNCILHDTDLSLLEVVNNARRHVMFLSGFQNKITQAISWCFQIFQ